MKIRKITAATIIAFLLIGSTSCSLQESNTEKGSTLSMYVMNYDVDTKNAIEKYNETHRGAEIKVKEFFDDQYSEMVDTLNTELTSGEGPDIILTMPENLKNLSKLMENGVFYDINKLIKEDKDFKQDDYRKEVFNCGMYKEKRYLVPLNFYVGAIFSTKEDLKKAGMSISEKGTLKELCRKAKNFMSQNRNSEKYLFDRFNFNSLIESAKTPFIDIENKRVSLDSEEFKSLLDEYKDVYISVLPKEKSVGITSINGTSKLLKDGETTLLYSPITTMKSLWTAYAAYDSEIEPEMFPAPGVENESSVEARPQNIVAINNNCKNKKGAFEFIKLLLSKEIQANNNNIYMPVNNKAYEQVKQKLLSNKETGLSYQTGRGGGFKSEESLKKLLGQLDGMLANMQNSRIVDFEISDIINSELQEFLNKGKSEEKIVKELQKKVGDYLNNTHEVQKKKAVGNISTDNSNTGTIKITYGELDFNIKNAVRKYKELYKNVKVEETIVPASESCPVTEKGLYEYRNKYATLLLSNDAPDIIVDDFGIFSNIHKVVENGIYCDLNELIKQDKEFKISDYYEKILDYGIYHGKRFFIPCKYEIKGVMTTKEALNANKININMSNWSWRYFADLAKKYSEGNKNSQKYFYDGNNYRLSELVESSGVKFIDYETKKSSFNSKEFLELLRAYKDIYEAKCPPNIGMGLNTYKKIFDSNVFSMQQNTSNPAALAGLNNDVEKDLGRELELYPYPTLNGSKHIYPTIYETVGINNKCKNKKEAFDFIKVLLSKDIQKQQDSYGNSNNMFFGSVNKKAYEEEKEFYTSGKARTSNIIPLPKRLTDQMDNVMESLESGELIDNEVYEMIDEEGTYFAEGKITADQAARNINEKVMIYLNE